MPKMIRTIKLQSSDVPPLRPPAILAEFGFGYEGSRRQEHKDAGASGFEWHEARFHFMLTCEKTNLISKRDPCSLTCSIQSNSQYLKVFQELESCLAVVRLTAYRDISCNFYSA